MLENLEYRGEPQGEADCIQGFQTKKEVMQMSFMTWADSRVKNLEWIDIKLIKLSVAGFVLMLAKLWEPLLSLDWYWYALIAVLAAVKPMLKVFGE